MGCHPSHWLSLHHFSRWAHCTTRLLAIINHIRIYKNHNHILTVYYTTQMVNGLLYSGKHTKNYGKSPLLMGKSTINVIRMGTLHHQPTGPHPLQVFCQPPPPEPALDTVPPQRSFDPRLAVHRDPPGRRVVVVWNVEENGGFVTEKHRKNGGIFLGKTDEDIVSSLGKIVDLKWGKWRSYGDILRIEQICGS